MNPIPRPKPTHTRLYIGGGWHDALSGRTYATEDPSTGLKIAEIAEARAEDVDIAVIAAREAFDEGPWRRISEAERGRLLRRVAELIIEHRQELAELESIDSGKPIHETLNVDIPLAAETFQYFAGWYSKITGSTIPLGPRYLQYTVREPLGVCALIAPWNFPLLMAARKLAPALIAGNTTVLKPAPETPLSSLRLAAIFEEAGFPPGVVNVVAGLGAYAGEALVSHPAVDKIAITGSTKTGQAVMRAAAQNITKLSLELSGKSPNIIMADADIDRAVRGVIGGIFYNKGEICTAGSRLFVQESVYNEVVEKLRARALRISGRQGDVLDPETRLGPQVSERFLNRALRYIDYGAQEGATLVSGGARSHPLGQEVGYFLEPTIFGGVTNDMRIAREEIFGPVLSVLRFKEIDEAIAQGNNSLYGLAAGVWTADLKTAHKAARQLQAGTVWVNCYNVFDAATPYGGVKRSGFGRENGYAAIEEYTHIKSVIADVG
jgi:acyl-CoA reductase-like NAD-dependent aldehyde dehydrogenase